jgi:CelD/BcsL family acetyltransferase involved in cellulose biosynthesis
LVAVSYHDTVNVLQDVATAPCGPFDRPEWFALLAEGDCSPLVVVARDGADALALPLVEANGRIEPLRNWYSFTWRAAGSRTPALLEAAARDLRSRTHRVTVWPVPDEDGSAARWTAAFRKAGWSVRSEPCDHNHVLAVGGRSFAEYWAQRPGQMRTTLKRKGKKVEVAILDRFDAPAWAAYEAIYDESWKPEEGAPELLRRFAQAEGAAGRIRLGIARAEGVPVAAQFWTVENGVAYIHKLAHRESAKPLSAGATLSAALFEHVIDRDKVDLVDFGTGNDSYKADWMELDRPRYRIDCLDPAQMRAWPALAKRKLARFRRAS